MKYQIKPLHHEAVPAALEKAERYRLLNEAREAESICLDVLEVEPQNHRALVTLLLALTDQFDRGSSGVVERAWELVPRLADDYSRAYYGGILHERRAKAALKLGGPRCYFLAYEELSKALEHFAAAEKTRPPGNEEAVLRWNTCVRILEANPRIAPEAPQPVQHMLE